VAGGEAGRSVVPFSPSATSQRADTAGEAPGEEGEELLLAENRDSAVLLMGRETYEFFADFWPQRKGRPHADIINRMPKILVPGYARFA
jgi:hypothetical protein